MSILDDLLGSLDVDAPIRTVLVGVHWTLVCSRHCGLASTLIGDKPHSHDPARSVGHLHEKSARELAEYARSDDLLEASIGVAALNSLLDVKEEEAAEINAFNVLVEEGRGRSVALVGHFPFIPKLHPLVRQLWVLEQHPSGDEYPSEATADLIPRADVIALTGSSLINHTLDGLLASCRPGAVVMILGPSTPLSPLLFSHGVTILSGSRVFDESAVLRTVSQGATFQQVEGVRLLSFWNKKERT
jgi:uncharacterized protein (DUF4213/DUF364 family)